MIRFCPLLVAVTSTFVVQDPPVFPGFGDPLEVDRDCAIKLDGKTLVMAVPGTDHDYRPGPSGRKAPRVVRDMEGNFTAKVQVGGDVDTSSAKPGQGAGLFLGQDERNFVRLERLPRPGPEKGAIFFEYWQDNQPKSGGNGVVEVSLKGDISWLRLTRRMDKLKAEVSADGKDWVEAKTLTIRLSSRLNLGVIATNTSGKPFEARFTGFEFKGIPLYP
jgi:regulation of enolase protein 1 (concanavalin A-like superfamily)